MSVQDPISPMDDVTEANCLPPTPHRDEGVYIYCIVPARKWHSVEGRLRTPAMGSPGRSIRLVRNADGDLAALVSDSPLIEYAISRDNLLTHEGVIEEAMAYSDVVPLRFGTMATSDDEVREALLEERQDVLHRLFARMEGRVELGLKVFWQRERLFAEIAAEDDTIRALRYAMQATGAPSFVQRLDLGRMTEQAVLGKREHEANRILDALDPLADETIVAPLRSDLMVLNAAFLVERSRVPAFDTAVGQLEATESGRLVIRYVGPVPPYSFANLVIDGEE